jgi:hypothetical protein
MRLLAKIALVTGVLALAIGPAALAAGKPETTGKPESVPPTEKGQANGPNYQPSEPGGQANPPSQAKAYGWACRGEARKRQEGDTEKGTPFSRCVKQMAQAAHHPNMAPGRVCKEESRKHEKGEKGTAFSHCVKNVVQLRRQERKEQREEEQEQSNEESTEATAS